MKQHGYRDQNEPDDGPHPKVKGFTGKYPHKDTPKIDEVTKGTLDRMKTFKGAKFTNSEWLTKKSPVRQEINEFYHPHKGQEEQ